MENHYSEAIPAFCSEHAFNPTKQLIDERRRHRLYTREVQDELVTAASHHSLFDRLADQLG